MKIKYVYLMLCIVGFILPYSQLVPLIMDQGFALNVVYNQLFANRVSTLLPLIYL